MSNMRFSFIFQNTYFSFPCDATELRHMAEHDKNISTHRMDVTCPDHIHAVSVDLLKQPIDLIVSNAGVYLEKYKKTGLGCINYDDWRYSFEVNTLGHIRVMEAFLPNLSMGKNPLYVIITTHMASIEDISEPGAYYYRSTKSALNAAIEGLTYELKKRNIGILLLHPGWYDRNSGGFSPSVTCCSDEKPGWIVYAESRGASLSVTVNDEEYIFIYGDLM